MVDAAQINPQWLQDDPGLHARLRLHAGADAAQLPFEADVFDAGFSQFGVEYIGTAAMRELHRVLRPGAVFAAVLHHRDSRLLRIAREELAQQAWLRRDDGLLALAQTLIAPLARSASAEGRRALRDDVAANAGMARLHATLHALEQRIAESAWPAILAETRDAVVAVLQLAPREGEEFARHHLGRIVTELDAMRLRQQDLVDCGLDADGLRELLGPLGDADPQIAVLCFDDGEALAWAVQVRVGAATAPR
jgi:SAM-dependent methyltransferase